MKIHWMKRILVLCLAFTMISSLGACGSTSSASNSASDSPSEVDFPTKAMTIVCPYSAGGGTDLALRILADCGKNVFNQTINVENKTGGSGTVGLTEVLNASPDGYMLGTASVDLITLPLLGLAPKELTREAFDPICVINGEPAAVIVPKDSKFQTIEELIDYAKQNPGEIRLANSGTGNIWHLAAIGIELKTGAKFTHVPYSDGSAQAIAAVLGKHVDAVVCSAAEAAANIDSGSLKVLAVANTDRLSAYPDIPTMKEKGIDLTIVALRGLCVRADTPDDIKQVLKDSFGQVIQSDECKKEVEAANMTYMPLNAEQTNQILDNMSDNLKEIIAAYKESAN